MTVELLCKTKLKIFFDAEDLRRHGVTYDRLDYASEPGRSVFREALAYARSETGFEADSGRLFVELFPAAGGGCVATVTKLCRAQSGDTADSSLHAPAQAPHPPGRLRVFQFCNADALLAARALFPLLPAAESALYGESERFLLALRMPRRLLPGERDNMARLLEFCDEIVCTPYALSALTERGGCIFSADALQRLS